jgi:hypothetical protein
MYWAQLVTTSHVSSYDTSSYAWSSTLTTSFLLSDISWLEIEKLVPTLVMQYDFKLTDDAKITEDCG